MSGKSKIEWTEKTWNPIVGCSVVSPGCTNCYAMRFAGTRLQHSPNTTHYVGTTQKTKAGTVWTGQVAQASDNTLHAPLRWKKPCTIFVNSMGDLFHESVPDEWIDRVFAVMALCPQHTFQVLTKRAERMREYMSSCNREPRWMDAVVALIDETGQELGCFKIMMQCAEWVPLPNVWLGVSAEDQKRADERIPALLDTPAAVRFVSAEPLLGPIDFERILYQRGYYKSGAHHYIDVLRGGFWSTMGPGYRASQDGEPKNHFTNHCDIKDRLLNWIIVGGESGRDARPMHPDWARSIRDQCAAAGVPFFFKQWGEWIGSFDAKDEMGIGDCAYGEWHGENEPFIKSCICRPGHGTVYRVGKARAGRLLDGVTHDAMPERTSA